MITEDEYQIIENVEPGQTIKLNLIQANGIQYGTKNGIQMNEADEAYRVKDYEKASAIAAMTVALDDNTARTFTAVGIVNGESVTDLNEKSWTCYVVK